MFDIVGRKWSLLCMCCDMYVWGGGGGGIYFIIIKMASVFKLPDVNVYVCVWGVGVRRNNVFIKSQRVVPKNWVAIFQVKVTGLKKKKKSNNNNFCSLQPPTWNGMLPECFSCLTITEREWVRGVGMMGAGRGGGEREYVCVCVWEWEGGRGREREREMCGSVWVFLSE